VRACAPLQVSRFANELRNRYNGQVSVVDDGTEHPHRLSLTMKSDIYQRATEKWSEGLTQANVKVGGGLWCVCGGCGGGWWWVVVGGGCEGFGGGGALASSSKREGQSIGVAARRTSTKHQHWPLGGAVMHCC
jgi:hypothetical protein